MEVTLTRQVLGNQKVEGKQTTEKLLLEDQDLLIKAICNSGDLDDLVAKINFSSDNGIEFVFNEKHNYLMLVTSFSIEYLQEY
jgi:hypothetical protein